MVVKKRQRRRAEVVVAESTVRVRVTALGNEEESTETITVQKFETDPAYVRVNAGVTKNIGDYESLRVDVAISTPCYKEEVDDIIPLVADIVADHLDNEVEKFLGGE